MVNITSYIVQAKLDIADYCKCNIFTISWYLVHFWLRHQCIWDSPVQVWRMKGEKYTQHTIFCILCKYEYNIDTGPC